MSPKQGRITGGKELAGRHIIAWRDRLPELILVLALLVVAAFLLDRHVMRQILMREGVQTQQFLQSVVRAENSEDTLFSQPAPSASLRSFVNHIDNLPAIVRLNLYSPDGIIRHSSEPNLVGIKFADNSELAESFSGSVKVELEEVTASDKAEHLALQSYGGKELIEAYIPLKSDSGKVFAVVEFYSKPEGAGSVLDSIRWDIWNVFLSISVLVTLLWVRLVRLAT